MKMCHTLLATSLLALAAPIAFASSHADLTAIGTIVPGSCTLALGNGGVISLGALDEANMLGDADNPLTPKSVSVSISCSAATKIAAMVTENRTGTASRAGASFFGLGKTTNGKAIGYYEAVAENGKIGATASTFITAPSTNGNLWATPSGDVKLEHGTGRKFIALGTAAAGPATVTTATLDLEVRPTIAPTKQLLLMGPETIDGSLTLDIVYL